MTKEEIEKKKPHLLFLGCKIKFSIDIFIFLKFLLSCLKIDL